MTTYEQRPDFADTDRHPEELKATVKSVYQQVAGEYDERIPGLGPSDDMFTQSERDFLLKAIRSGEKVLDIGCGTGRFTVPMAEKGADVSGLDISRPMLDVASSKLAERGLSADLREGDMAHLPFPDASFDTVTSMLALMHVPLEDRPAVFGEVARVLRPGGRMLLGVKNSVFEEMFTGDRFASVDVTDVVGKQLLFTKTRSGEEYVAPWYSFSPQDLTTLFATVGMTVTRLRGNSPLAVWLADEVLRDESVRAFVSKTERFLAEVPPFNHFGYHLLVEATKPRV
ncbi:ubiquinone biosynthesis methyltransferase UbiE [Streptomyces cyaneogriseus subsp. noncyanogenus]|uniref:Ubiquinone biosynthesis methyltransferase UbiE n=1 Tax=Streptomyces cyaneogriseus subsp. noncyanogenus TaxID=477245 RepID=A0A0C5FST5_9ACTN|nr:class I SAM-dependent methyltransferase [Streptomyces cyaneogriseus]AJP00738.1 ubiquinone biosynthesis methyltransferase UbiE [Streptomyces cyaneogriseus subsp. noncyanogenus]